MKDIKDSIKLMRFNRRNVLLFEGILLIVSYAIFMPVLNLFFNLSIRFSKIRYISKENILRYFKSPSAYIFLLVAFLMITFFLLVNVSGIIYAYDAANDMKRISAVRIFARGLRNAVRIFRPQNLLLIPYMIFLFPISGVAIVSISYINLGIPPYLSQLIKASPLSISAIGVIYAVMSLAVMASIFSIYEFSLKRESFITSMKLGREALKRAKLKDFIIMVIWNISVIFLMILLNGVLLSFLRNLAEKYISSGNAVTIVYGMLDMINFVLVLIITIIALPMSFAVISNSYYNLNPNKEGIPNIDDMDYYASKLIGRQGRRTVALILIVALLLDGGFLLLRKMDIISPNIAKLHTAEVTAHRGASHGAPENTLAAFSLAIEEGADYIELDVRETKDGELIIMHDENLKRTCGVDKKVGKQTFKQIRKYSAGKKFSKKFKDEKVPTLREAIELIGDSAVINIEIKTSNTDKHLVEGIVDLVHEYNIGHQVVIASTSSKALRKVKELDPSLKTVYIMQIAYGDFYSMSFVDVYSVKYTFVSYDMVKKIHNMGKEIYVWTVDDRNVLEQMMQKNVDNIITNNPEYVKETMSSIYEEGSLYDIISSYIESKAPKLGE